MFCMFSADRIPTIIRHVSNSDTCLHPEGTAKKPDAGSVFVRGHYSTIRVVIHAVANHTPVPDQADLEVLALYFLEHFRQCLVVDHPAMQLFLPSASGYISMEVSVPSMPAVISLLYIASAASFLCTAGTAVGQLTFPLLTESPAESGLLWCAFRWYVFLCLLLGQISANGAHRIRLTRS